MVGQQQEERLMSELIYIDRRKAGRGKSLPNRQLFIRRIREFIKKSKPQNIGTGGSVGKTSNQQSNPVKVAAEALEEPRFVYRPNSGENVWIINGNPKFMRGDEIDLEQQGQGGQGAGQGAGSGGEGEDSFVINIAADEFFDLFFEDCELPNLTNEKETDKLENDHSHAGFTTNGIPAQLSVVRTYKQALGRRRALGAPYQRELHELQEEQKMLLLKLSGTTDEEYAKDLDRRLSQIEERIVVLQRKIAAIAAFDKVDLRYRKTERRPLHTVDAVLIMIMDISGSMGEHEKTVARRWFATLYAFMKRRYATCDLIFIAHTSDAYEMSENDFFSTRMNGGTMVSPALVMANKIIKERYDHTQTNIYISNASDGDNWTSDNAAVIEEMEKLIPKIQHFSYIETPNPWLTQYYEQMGMTSTHDTTLWETYEQVDVPNTKMSMSVIRQPEDVYGTFKKIFAKRPK
jgi:hypothetical protein